MQLPRGTFREIRKRETIESLLLDLERSKFSGICSISSATASGTIALKGGKCILVKFQGKPGDAGWEELQKCHADEVDAALSTLDEAQIQLSLEFNKICRIVKAGKTAPELSRPVSPPSHEPVKKPAPPVAAARPVARPAVPAPAIHRPAPPVQPPAAPEQKTEKGPSLFQRPAMPAPPAPAAPVQQHKEKRASPVNEDAGNSDSSFENDIDTFVTMDLDNVTDKIRNDCKTMIKQLHLDHLMDR